MRRFISFFLTAVILLTCSVALADDWTCPNCGKLNSGDLCPDCGAEKPEPAISCAGTCWKFDVSGRPLLLAFPNENEFITTFGDNILKGVYTLTGTQVELISNGSSAEQGAFSETGDRLTFDTIGTGLRTDEKITEFEVLMEGDGMADTLAEGDRLKLEIMDPSELKRFSIVAVHYYGLENSVFINRLIGLPGDTLQLKDGYLFVNGEKQEEPYINDEYRTGPTAEFGPYTVPEGRWYVMGDRRNSTKDSRAVGPLSSTMLLGTVTEVNGIPVASAND